MKILITGGCGFLGSNLAVWGTQLGHEILVMDNLSRVGSELNKSWLTAQHYVQFVHGDIRFKSDIHSILSKFKPEIVFHLAGQVAMTTSIANPMNDFAINAKGTLNLLESVREVVPDCGVVYSSTNKVYGDLEQYRYSETDTRFICDDFPRGFGEETPLAFQSPYGCSKGAADQYLIDYAKVFGLNTCLFRHSSMFGGRQFPTFDQGWIGWFCIQAFESAKNPSHAFTISGNGKQVRDVLHAEDMCRLYYAAASKISKIAGQAFNIGGGFDNSLSLIELFSVLDKKLGIKMVPVKTPKRESDQKVFIADLEKASKLLDWKPEITADRGIDLMLDWVREHTQ
jgi:CDP-paratose 2-epimerase